MMIFSSSPSLKTQMANSIQQENATESDKLFVQDFFSLFHKWVSKLLQTDVGLMNESSQKKKDMAKEFSRCHFAIR